MPVIDFEAWKRRSQREVSTSRPATTRSFGEVHAVSNGSPTAPYTLEITPSLKGDGSFGWAIRLNGKMFERSDRSFRSEQEARKNGQEALERASKGEAQSTSQRRR